MVPDSVEFDSENFKKAKEEWKNGRTTGQLTFRDANKLLAILLTEHVWRSLTWESVPLFGLGISAAATEGGFDDRNAPAGQSS